MRILRWVREREIEIEIEERETERERRMKPGIQGWREGRTKGVIADCSFLQ